MEHYILKAENVIAGRNLQTLWNAAVEVKDGKIAEIYETEAEIPEELLNQKKVDIYTASREDLGVPAIDRKGLEGFIDSIPEIPIAVRDNLKEDARIKKFDLKKRMIYDIEEFSEEDSE